MPLNPFESKRNFGAHLAELGVRNGMVAEECKPDATLLLWFCAKPRMSRELFQAFLHTDIDPNRSGLVITLATTNTEDGGRKEDDRFRQTDPAALIRAG